MDDVGEAACVSWVRDLAPDEVLRRLGGTPPFTPRTFAQLDAELIRRFHEGITIGGVAHYVDDRWTLLVEPNG